MIPASSHLLFKLFLLSFLLTTTVFAQNGVPKSFNVQGTIYSPASSNPYLGLSNIRFQILNAAGTCVMYEETVTAVDTTTTNGSFSIDVGSTGVRINNIDSTTVLGLNLFQNNITHPSIVGCTGAIVIAAAEKRKLRIAFDTGGGYSDMSPDVEMLSAPYAMIAETLDGHAANEFIMANSSAGVQVTQANLETLLNDITKFNMLNNFANTGDITGNAATATTATTVSNGAITAAKLAQMGAATGQVMKWNGAAWVASNDNSGAAAVTSTDITSALGFVPVAPTDTIANATNAVNATNATTAVNFSGSLSGDVSGTQSATVVDSVGGKTSAQIATSVTDTQNATNLNTASALVKRDGSGNIAVSTVSATNTSTNNVYLFDAGNINRILFKAPSAGITNYTLTLPPTVGTNGQVLSTNASGDLSWTNASAGSVTDVTASAPLASSGGATPNITLTKSSATVDGYLASDDFTTFSNKQAAGNYIIALSDDVTLSGFSAGTATATIANDAVTTAKVLNGAITSAKILDGTITSNDLSQMGASLGQSMRWNGSAWEASTDSTNGLVTTVTASAPLASSGGGSPNITLTQSTTTVDGYLSSTDFTTFNSKQAGSTELTGLAGLATLGFMKRTGTGTYSTVASIDLTTSVMGLLPVANGGTGAGTFSANQILLGNGTSALSSAGAMTNGQILIGSTGVAPVVATVGSSNGISLTAGAGSLSIGTNATTTAGNNTLVMRDGSGITQAYGVGVSGATSGSVLWTAPSIVTDYSLQLPAVQGGANTVLQNNGAGVLSWSTLTNGTVTSTTGTLPISVANGTTTPVISISKSTATVDGYLASSDFSTFSNKQNALGYTPVNRAGDTMTGDLNLGGNKILNLKNAANTSVDPTVAEDGKTLRWNNTSQQWEWFTAGVAGAGITLLNGESGSTQSFATGTAGTDFGIVSGSGVHTFNFPNSSVANRGLLTSADFTTFNSKQSSSTELTGLAGLATLGFMKRTGTGTYSTVASIDLTTSVMGALPIANGGTNATTAAGARSSFGLDTGNSPTFTGLTLSGVAGNTLVRTDGSGVLANATSADVTGLLGYMPGTGSGTVTSTTGTLPISVVTGTTTPVISISKVTASVDGYLSSSDFTTFSNKQAAGNYITALTGDVAASGPGSAAATIAANAITSAKILDGTIASNDLSAMGASTLGQVMKWNGSAWMASTDLTTSPLSAISAATTTNTIDNLLNAQTWNWSTATTQSPMSISADALTTGSLFNLTSSSGAMNSTNGLLNVANTGTSTFGIVARIQSNSTAGSGLTVLADGSVGIGTTAPTLGIGGAAGIQVVGTTNGVLVLNGGGVDSAIYGSSGGIYFRNNGTVRNTMTATGDFGLGLFTGINAKLHQDSGNGANTFHKFTAGTTTGQSATDGFNVGITGSGVATLNQLETQPMTFATSGTERMRIDSAGNIGIGTTTPAYALQVSGDISISGNYKINGVNISNGTVTSVSGTSPISVATGTTTPVISISKSTTSVDGYLSSTDFTTFNSKVGGTGTTGVLPKFSASGTLADSIIKESAGKIGINVTAAPAFPLEVYGAGGTGVNSGSVASFSSGATTNGNAYGIEIDKDGIDAVYWGINKDTPTGSIPANGVYMTTFNSNSTMTFGRDQSSPTADLHINGSGLVGIGTASPTQKLSVVGNLIVGPDQNSNSTANLQVQDETTNLPWISLNSTPTTSQIGNDATGLIIGNDNADIQFKTGTQWNNHPSIAGTIRMSIKNGGNIGIGTTTPSAVLHLKAGTAAANSAPLKLTSGVNLTTPEAGTIEYDGTYLYYTDSVPTRKIIATASGGTLIGALISVAGSAAAPGIGVGQTTSGLFSGGTNILGFSTAGTERMRIDAAGNVGIGTSTPSAVLHLKPGTASAGTAPLKITAGVNLTAPEAGAIENDGTNLFYTNSAATRSYIMTSDYGVFSSYVEGWNWNNTVYLSSDTTAAPAYALRGGNPNSANGTISTLNLEARNSSSNSQRAYFGAVSNSGAGVYTPSVVIGQQTGASSYQERMRIDSSGYVGVATITPRAALDVSGTVLTKPSTLNSTTTVDFLTGNLQHTAASCQAFAMHNMKDGGSYTFAVQGATSATCSFTAFSDAGVTSLTVHMPSDHAASTAAKHTLYSFLVMGTHVYVTWLPDL